MTLFHIDRLSWWMLFTILIAGLSIFSFSKRQLDGDRLKARFLSYLSLLIVSICLFVTSDHLLFFLASWLLANLSLIRLMSHKENWKPAIHSSTLAARALFFGFSMLFASTLLLSWSARSLSIQKIVVSHHPLLLLNFSLFLLILAAVVQSGIWPFHKWLLSSLNSPTPVSAIMHAGLVNGGGFMLARFSPLHVQSPFLLKILLFLGMVSAILGTGWKFIQSDIKKMLACSTIAQMGFMFIQLSLGLWAAAMAHLSFHSFFKAYLFLGSGSAAKERSSSFHYPPSCTSFFLSLFFGLLGAFAFKLTSSTPLDAGLTTLFLLQIAAIGSAQVSLAFLGEGKAPLYSFLGGVTFGLIYGLFVRGVKLFLSPLDFPSPFSLEPLHWGLFSLLFLFWALVPLTNFFKIFLEKHSLAKKIYVAMLNGSLSDPKTLTLHRNNYSPF